MKTVLMVLFSLSIASFGQFRNINRISNCHLSLHEDYTVLLNNNELEYNHSSIDPNVNNGIECLGSTFPLIEFSIEPNPDGYELASSSISGEVRKVVISSHLVNTKLIGLEAKMLIIAHQIAHHYGGDHPYELEWNSSEKDADIHAISRVLPRIWIGYDINYALIKGCSELKKVWMLTDHPTSWKLDEHLVKRKNALLMAIERTKIHQVKTEDCLISQG